VERTVSTIALPNGNDPDDFIRKRGTDAFKDLLKTPRSMAASILAVIRKRGTDAFKDLLKTPRSMAASILAVAKSAQPARTVEQRAGVMARLEGLINEVGDTTLQWEYRRSLCSQLRKDFKGLPPPVDRSGLAGPITDSGHRDSERLRILTAILLRHPVLLHDVDHAWAGLALPHPYDRLREALRAWVNTAEVLDSQALTAHLTFSGLQAEVEQALAAVPVPLPACASLAAMPAEAEAGWWHIFGFLNVDRLREEVALAEAACGAALTSQSQSRLLALKAALNKVNSGEPDGVDLAA
jgi:DNA primase